MERPEALRALTEEERQALETLRAEELKRELERRLQTQTERHDGGSHYIGTGGTSPFGHGGYHPSGVRIGEAAQGGGGSAVQIAELRRFRELRKDLTLDVRQIGVALRRLRALTRDGRQDELDLEGTVEATSKNAGDLEIIWRAPRKNRVKLLLLMDVGGSMTPYSKLCSRLFSAAHQASHFKQFESYYFHNCPYDRLYEEMAQRKSVATREVLSRLDASCAA